MRRRVVPNRPRFRLRWLATPPDDDPDWLHDPEWVPHGDRAFYRRVKDGLLALLADLDREGPVLLPAYIPVGVVSAVLAAGFDVRYYPVDADLTLPVADVVARIDALDPAVVLVVHYLGFADEGYPRLREAARERGALIVEDVARGLFGRGPDGELLGSTGEVALFCAHKTLPARNGGLLVRRDAPLEHPTTTCHEWGDLLRVVGGAGLETLGVDGRSRPSRVDGARGALVVDEIAARSLCSPGPLSSRAFAHTSPAVVQSERLDRYRALRSRLEGAGVEMVTPPAPAGAAPYGVGILAPSEAARNRLFDDLRRRGLPAEALTWPPVHRHDAVAAMDGAMALRRRLLVLPTHQQVPRSTLREMADRVIDVLG